MRFRSSGQVSNQQPSLDRRPSRSRCTARHDEPPIADPSVSLMNPARLISARLRWLLVAAIISTGVIFTLVSGNTLRYPDEREYHELATRLVEGKGFVTAGSNPRPTALRVRGGVSVDGVLSIDAKPVLAKLANSLLLAVCALCVLWLVSRVTPAGGLISLALILMYPRSLPRTPPALSSPKSWRRPSFWWLSFSRRENP